MLQHNILIIHTDVNYDYNMETCLPQIVILCGCEIHNLTKPHKGHECSNKITTLIIGNMIFIEIVTRDKPMINLTI